MPDTTTVQARCEAATPTLGVRLWIARDKPDLQDMVCLQIGNEGGRGKALAAVVVPVEPLPGLRVRLKMDLDDLNGAAARDLHWRDNNVLPTPFSLRWYGDQWCRITREAEWVLILMIYPNPRFPQACPAAISDQVAALEAFFNEDGGQVAAHPANKIRRGLVHLATRDIPPSTKPAEAGAEAKPEPAPAAACPPPRMAFTFALASCQYPAGLVDGTPQRFGSDSSPAGPADASMLRLAQRLDDPTLDDAKRPSLLVLTGDQIYADATAGLFDPRAGGTPKARSSIRDAEDWLRIPYQNWLGSVGAQSVLGKISSRMMLDDHEIDDNWEPLAPTARPADARRVELLMQAGSQGYQRYQRDLREAKLLNVLWHTHRHRGIRFFLADTRTEREARQAAQDPLRPCIMSGFQTSELHDWIGQEPDQPAFVVSPAMLLPRRRSSTARLRAALHSDAWDGYPGSLHRLLVHIWKTGRSNLVFLSGDEHLSSVVKATITKADVPDRSVTLHSVHSSGLYSPYPFANAVPALFALPDEWNFDDPDDPDERGEKYHCKVEACAPWVPGDGFALLRLAPPADGSGAWRLDVSFDRAARAARDAPVTVRLRLAP